MKKIDLLERYAAYTDPLFIATCNQVVIDVCYEVYSRYDIMLFPSTYEEEKDWNISLWKKDFNHSNYDAPSYDSILEMDSCTIGGDYLKGTVTAYRQYNSRQVSAHWRTEAKMPHEDKVLLVKLGKLKLNVISDPIYYSAVC